MTSAAGRHEPGEVVNVLRADVALVGPRVDGDAVRTGLERHGRGVRDARPVERAGVAQPGHFVEIDRQRGRGRVRSGAGGDERVHRGA